MNTNVLWAVFKRNFFSYFANPAGYVFICVFVFLSAIWAFWPDEFFNANLANLDQLNKYFPFIMLFFVPAITMSIWAEETRQGTDELLLTIPATDFDIVLGKYLAAVAIYTVALLISMGSNFMVLRFLGDPDKGLYVCTHFGYWLLGLSMLSIGMVASFLTRNLSVAYILGALFNAPLVLMACVDVIPGLTHASAASVRQWSLGGQCQEFGRGLIGFSGILYFLFIAAIMLYVCMVLIGRRHWARGEDTGLQSGHYLVRAVALLVIGAAAVFTIENHEQPVDATSERLSSLSPDTIKLVKDLKTDFDEAIKLQPQISELEGVVKSQEKEQTKKEQKKKDSASKAASAPKASAAPTTPPQGSAADAKSTAAKPETKAVDTPAAPLSADAKKLAELKEQFDKLKVQGPVRIDAFISTEVPPSYNQTRINLLADLQAIKNLGGSMVELNINEMTHGDPMADVAKTRYNIVAKDVFENRGGSYKKDNIFLGVAFTCGLEKVILPFVDKGLPAEYELVRSLCTVTRQKRKRIGVLDTDAHVMGNFTQMGMSPSWQLIEELKKQYEVVQVSPGELSAERKPGEAEKHYDVLLAIQPSAMGPQEMDGFVKAIRAGQPTVIFEDPLFLWMQGIPGTYQPRQSQQNPMMGFGRENQEKGDIRALWRLLGIDFSDGGEGDEFNPMSGPQPSRGTERIVWQRYNPFPKLGDAIIPELVFIDPACGAKEPFNEKDPISSKLQNVFFPGPGFIEDTPDVVKRLIAKWHNVQYAKLLEQKMRKLATDFDTAKSQNNSEKIHEIANNFAELEEEKNLMSSGGDGAKTLHSDQIKDDATLKSLLKDLDGTVDVASLSDLRRDLRNRFPIRVAGEGISEDEASRIADEDPDRLRLEAGKLREDAARINGEAAKLNGEAAKARQQAAHASEETAKLEESVANLKESLSQATTVEDAIKYAQAIQAMQIKDRTFTPLIETSSDAAGTVPVGKFLARNMFEGETLNPARSLYYQPSDGQQYVLAAHIQGKPSGAKKVLNVVLVADVDMVVDQFFRWREAGGIPGLDIDISFDNVNFALNALDSLAGDERFLELRKRRPQHRTLQGFEEHTKEAKKESAQARKEKSKEHDDSIKKAVAEGQAKLKELGREVQKGNVDDATLANKLAIIQKSIDRKLEEQKAESDRKYNDEMRKINEAQDGKIRAMQGTYKFWAVVIPPIPPLVVAALVFLNRRSKEREGVSSKRLR